MLVRALPCFLLAAACAKQESPIIEGPNTSSSEMASPSKHFRMTGEIVFRLEDRDVTQQGELWLGSEDRMRFKIGIVGAKNIFLFDAGKGCWHKTPGTAFKEDLESADVFGIETKLRWHILNMSKSEGDQQFSVSLNDNNLPSEVSLGEYVVQLSEYKALGKKGALYPTVWHWITPRGIRIETVRAQGKVERPNRFCGKVCKNNRRRCICEHRRKLGRIRGKDQRGDNGVDRRMQRERGLRGRCARKTPEPR